MTTSFAAASEPSALAEMLTTLKASVDAFPTAVIVVNQRGQLVIANKDAATLFAYSMEELLSLTVEDLMPRAYRHQHLHDRREYFAYGQARPMNANRELQGLRKDGEFVSLQIGLNPIRFGGEKYVLAVIHDLSPQVKRAHWFRAMVESAPIAMALVDGTGHFVETNRKMEELFGYLPKELIGMQVEDVVPARFRNRHRQVRSAFQSSSSACATTCGRTVTGLRRDGGEIELEISLNPLLSDSMHGHVVLMASDVTEQRQREREREENAERLKKVNQALDEFAYVASHDLQEPLRTISASCDVLQEEYSHCLDSPGQEFLSFAANSARRMQAMIADLLAFSRLPTDAQTASKIELSAACQAALDNLQLAIQESGAEIRCGTLPSVRANQGQMTQVLQNLIGNAIKYRGERTPEIEVGARRDGDCWHCYVKDNGIGIAPKNHERVFAIFHRLHRKEEYAGTGIGLAIVKRIIEMTGGRVWIESELGVGTTVHFTVPDGAPPSDSENPPRAAT